MNPFIGLYGAPEVTEYICVRVGQVDTEDRQQS